MKTFKTFSIKIEDAIVERISEYIEGSDMTRNRFINEAILDKLGNTPIKDTRWVEFDLDKETITKIDKDRGELKMSREAYIGMLLREDPKEVTPKTTQSATQKVTPKYSSISDHIDFIDGDKVTPSYTKSQAMGIVNGYYLKHKGDLKGNAKDQMSQILREAEELMSNPNLVSCYQ